VNPQNTPPVWRDGGDLLLRCKVQPGARHSAFVGTRNLELVVRLNAPAIDGKANAALRQCIASAFAVPAGRVVIERGEFSRHKTLRVIGVTDVPALLTGLVNGGA
jgi:uncharacterized protein (TIGR00251 family)